MIRGGTKQATFTYDHRGYIYGSCPMVAGPITVEPDSSQLILYYTPLDPLLPLPLEREIFWAPSLDSLLLQIHHFFDFDVAPVTFEFLK